jgi:DNA-binding NarL/FixJ family response regulator
LPQPRCRILIADEHHAIRQGVRTILESRHRWQIVGEASDGREALRLVRKTRPDIAVLGYSLPGMNGLKLTSAIKHELPRAEILIYTMHNQESIMREVLRVGARGYVLKADDTAHLLAAVEALALHKPYFSPAIPNGTVQHFFKQDNPSRRDNVLTPREREIVRLIAKGRIKQEIACMLGISIKTVETHRAAAMEKLDLWTPAQLVLYAVLNNMVQA